jgi:hypothetical protein
LSATVMLGWYLGSYHQSKQHSAAYA